MLTQFQVQRKNFDGTWGTAATFPLRDPTTTIVGGITGLESVEAEMADLEYASVDGVIAARRKFPGRDLEITLLPADRVNDSQVWRRNISYQFPPKKHVKLTFTSPSRTVYTEGVVLYNEFAAWSSQPMVTVHITCPDPYLYTDTTTTANKSSKSGALFSYAFSNESLSEALIELSTNTVSGDYILYNGDIDVGFTATLTVTKQMDTIMLLNSLTQSGITLDGTVVNTITGDTGGFKVDDIITINTRPGQKAVTLTRATASGTAYVYNQALVVNADSSTTDWNILGCVKTGGVWPTLTYGQNAVAVTANQSQTGVSNAAGDITFTISYEGAYEGT